MPYWLAPRFRGNRAPDQLGGINLAPSLNARLPRQTLTGTPFSPGCFSPPRWALLVCQLIPHSGWFGRHWCEAPVVLKPHRKPRSSWHLPLQFSGHTTASCHTLNLLHHQVFPQRITAVLQLAWSVRFMPPVSVFTLLSLKSRRVETVTGAVSRRAH